MKSASLLRKLFPSPRPVSRAHLLRVVLTSAATALLASPQVRSAGTGAAWAFGGALPFLGILALSVAAIPRIALSGEAVRPRYVILGAAYALCTLLGQSLDAASTLSPLYQSAADTAIALARFAGLTALYGHLAQLAGDAVTLIRKRAAAKKQTSWEPTRLSIRGHRVSWRGIVLVLTACWGIYVLVFFPGSIPVDTSHQLAELYGTEGTTLTNHFPFATSMVYGLLFDLGTPLTDDGVASVLLLTLFQLAVGVAVFTTIIHWMAKLGAPARLCWCSLAFVALLPVFPTYVVIVGKDTLHAQLLALLVLQLALRWAASEGCKEARGSQLAAWQSISLVALGVCLTRNNGIFIAVFALTVAGVALRAPKAAASVCAVATLYLAWQALALPCLGVAPTETGEMLSVPAQATARYYAQGNVPDEETHAVLSSAVGEDATSLGMAYNPEISDPVKGMLDFGEAPVGRFLAACLEVAAADPGSALAGALNTTYGFWYPFDLGSYWNEDEPYYPKDDDGYSYMSSSWFAGTPWTNKWNDDHALAMQILRGIHVLVPGISHLYRPGTYCWLLLFLIAYSWGRHARLRLAILVSAPLLMLLCTLLAGPCASLRYSLPLIFSLPVMALVLALPMRDEPAL